MTVSASPILIPGATFALSKLYEQHWWGGYGEHNVFRCRMCHSEVQAAFDAWRRAQLNASLGAT